MKRYEFVMDVGYPVFDYKDCRNGQEALEKGKDLLAHTNASSITVYDGNKQIGDFDCTDEL